MPTDHPILCYVAGPYTDPDPLQVERNILEAKLAVREVIRSGMIPLAPTLASARFDWYMPDISAQWWYDATMEMLRRCDCIWMFGDWWESRGALKEVLYALEKELPVYIQGSLLDEDGIFSHLHWVADILGRMESVGCGEEG